MPPVTRGHRAWSLVAVGVLLATWVAVAQQGRPVNDAVLRTAPTTGEEWLTYGLDLGEKRFSPLNQINTTNVSRLGLAWSYDIPGTFGNPPGGGNQEATPLDVERHALRHHHLERRVRRRCANRQGNSGRGIRR